jgi:hypothetical protein
MLKKLILKLVNCHEVAPLDPIHDLRRAMARASSIKALEPEIRKICARQVELIDLTDEVPPTLRTGEVST